jgi:uncharacterized protein (TIGR02118 family)
LLACTRITLHTLGRLTALKFIGFIKRKEGMTLEDFSSYWRYKHAAMIAATPGLRRYVQNHVIPDVVDRYDPQFDGSAEAWFDDEAGFQAAIASDAWQAAVADAPNFIGSTGNLRATEVTIVEDGKSPREREAMVKYMGLLTKLDGWTVDAFQKHWRDVHGPLVKAEFTMIKRYVQNHALPETYGSDRPPFVDGVPEAWFESLETFPWQMVRRPEGPRTTPAGIDSATIFVQPIPALVVREVVIVD